MADSQLNTKSSEALRSVLNEAPRSTGRGGSSGRKATERKEGDHDSGVDETTQAAPARSTPSARSRATTPGSSGQQSRQPTARSRSAHPAGSNRVAARSQSVPKPFSAYGTRTGAANSEKKVPMNKVKVGLSESPNLAVVKSKIGSLANTTYKPGGGDVKIENRKLEWRAAPRTQAKNESYKPQGGDKKIESKKLVWNAQSKIGSLENANHKAGGGAKKIESQKLTWRAESKVGSKDYLTHKPGGGQVKITNQKIEVTAKSKIGSMDNIKHRPGGGDKKVYNDVDYLRQKSSGSSVSGPNSRRQSANHPTSGPQSLDSVLVKQTGPASESFTFQMRRKMSPMTSGF